MKIKTINFFGVLSCALSLCCLALSCSSSSGKYAVAKAAAELNSKCPKSLGNGMEMKSVEYVDSINLVEVKTIVNANADYVPRDEINAIKQKFVSQHQWKALQEADATIKYVYLNKHNDIITTLTVSPADM